MTDSNFDNLYDKNNTATHEETKTLEYLIFQAIRTHMLDAHTAFPAKITKIITTNMVCIQPLLKRKYANGTIIDLPVIQNVPVIMPNNGTYWIKLPFKVNDTGLAIISERSLDAWKVSGGSIDPKDPRIHDLSDAVFMPGLYPMSAPIPPPPTTSSTTDLVVHNGSAEVILQAAGTFLLKNGTDEFMNLMQSLLTALVAVTTNTALGPQPFNNLVDFQQLLTKFIKFVGA